MTPTIAPPAFACSICGESSTTICVFCTKDACRNHRCHRCKRCSDCCECDIPLDASDVIVDESHTEATPVQSPVEPTLEEVVSTVPFDAVPPEELNDDGLPAWAALEPEPEVPLEPHDELAALWAKEKDPNEEKPLPTLWATVDPPPPPPAPEHVEKDDAGEDSEDPDTSSA